MDKHEILSRFCYDARLIFILFFFPRPLTNFPQKKLTPKYKKNRKNTVRRGNHFSIFLVVFSITDEKQKYSCDSKECIFFLPEGARKPIPIWFITDHTKWIFFFFCRTGIMLHSQQSCTVQGATIK